MNTELEAILIKYNDISIPVAVKILRDLGINPDAPAGTAKHRYQSYTKMMDTALPIFQEEQRAVRHDYPHIPCGIFEQIKNAEPKP